MSTVLVIGATSAIAGEIARRYAGRGDDLYLMGRDEARLTALARELGPAVVGTAVADLDETAANPARIAAAIDSLGRIDVAVLAHGWLGDQERAEQDPAHAEAILHTNFVSMVSLIVPLANAMEAAGRGHLAVLSSVAGERGRPRNYTYGAAKGGLTIYLQGLRSRLWRRGVVVHTFKLGPVDTPMTASHAKNATFAHAPEVAQRIVAHIDRGTGAAYVPWFWGPIMAVVRRLPEPIFQRLRFLSDR